MLIDVYQNDSREILCLNNSLPQRYALIPRKRSESGEFRNLNVSDTASFVIFVTKKIPCLL